MKIKEIEALIDFINRSGLEEVNIETEEIKLSIKRNSSAQIAPSPAAVTVPSLTVPAQPVQSTQQLMSADDAQEGTKEAAHYVTIKSPMIGTFYRSANPDSPYFVQEGQPISANQTVCIIEAMKLFNEIEAEVSGTVVKVLVEDASPVEYDQPLFLVNPDL